jgi:hypothetical protein
MTNLSAVTMNVSNETGLLSFSRMQHRHDSAVEDEEELSCGSTMLKDCSYGSPKQARRGLHTLLSSNVLKFMTPRPKSPAVLSRLATFRGRNTSAADKEMTLSDLRSLPKSPSKHQYGNTNAQDSTFELFSHSTGTIDEGPSSHFPRTNFLSMPLSAGANDIASWTQKSRRRRRRGKTLQAISWSLRSLPRELELQLDEENTPTAAAAAAGDSQQEYYDYEADLKC